MRRRCPVYVELFENSFRKRLEVVDTATDPENEGLTKEELDKKLALKERAFELAIEALKTHMRACPRCAHEGNWLK